MPLSYEELHDIVEDWVDTALQLSEKNRRLMAYFARAQTHRAQETQAVEFVSEGTGNSRWTDRL